MTRPKGWYPGKRCTCAARQPGVPCNLTDCGQRWARKYRQSIKPRWWERVAGFFAALAWWRYNWLEK